MLSIGETWFSIIRLYGNRPSRNSFQRREEWSNVDRAWKTHWRTIKAAKHSKVRSSKIDRRVLASPLPPAFIGQERASRIDPASTADPGTRGCFWKLLSNCVRDVSMVRNVKTLTSSPVASQMESYTRSVKNRDLFFFLKFLTILRFLKEKI